MSLLFLMQQTVATTVNFLHYMYVREKDLAKTNSLVCFLFLYFKGVLLQSSRKSRKTGDSKNMAYDLQASQGVFNFNHKDDSCLRNQDLINCDRLQHSLKDDKLDVQVSEEEKQTKYKHLSFKYTDREISEEESITCSLNRGNPNRSDLRCSDGKGENMCNCGNNQTHLDHSKDASLGHSEEENTLTDQMVHDRLQHEAFVPEVRDNQRCTCLNRMEKNEPFLHDRLPVCCLCDISEHTSKEFNDLTGTVPLELLGKEIMFAKPVQYFESYHKLMQGFDIT